MSLEYDQGIFTQIRAVFEELYNTRGKPGELDEAFATEFLRLVTAQLVGEESDLDAQAATLSLQNSGNSLVDTTITTGGLSFVGQAREPLDRGFWKELVGSIGKNIKQVLFKCIGHDRRSVARKLSSEANSNNIPGYGQNIGIPMEKNDAATFMSERVEGFVVMAVHNDDWFKRFLFISSQPYEGANHMMGDGKWE
ncbi:hypothetical protein FRC07_000811 [Ceratobasidium sp. 392]|nr:hypothetical protein FRC07_000811 [Ceratobasidium sp. 392]